MVLISRLSEDRRIGPHDLGSRQLLGRAGIQLQPPVVQFSI